MYGAYLRPVGEARTVLIKFFALSMRALLQRVSEAKVTVNDERVGEIGAGLLILLAVHERDEIAEAERLAKKILNLRIFPDEQDKMNLT